MTYYLPKQAHDGFTMIETIIVLLVVGILSAALLVRADGVSKRNVPDQADLLRRDLMHIQSVALTYGIAVRLNVTSSGYAVTCLAAVSPCVAVGNTLIDPSTSQAFAVTLPSGMTMTSKNASNSGAATVDFDSIGRPSSGGNLIAENPVRTFALIGASRTSTVHLRPITGFAEVSY